MALAAPAAQEPAQDLGDASPVESYDDILGRALTSGAPSLLPDPDNDEPDESEDDDEDGGTAPPLDGEESDEDAPDDGVDPVDHWLGIVTESPRRIAEVPRKLLPDAFERLFSGVRSVITERETTAFNSGMQLAGLRIEAQRLDQLRDDGDLDGYAEGLAAYPGGKQNFRRVLAGIEPVEAKQDSDPSAAGYQAQANALWESLSAYPAAQQELRGKWNFAPTVEGITALGREVGRLEAKYERAAAKPDPSRVALDKRAEAQKTRRTLPKPDASSAGGGGGEADVPFNVNDLLRAGFRAGKRS